MNMIKLVNNFMHNNVLIYIAAILAFLTPSKINKYIIITSIYIIILKMYKLVYLRYA